MFSPVFLALSSSVLLASNASILSGNTSDPEPTTSLKGFSFAARATPNADKGSPDNHTLQNGANMQVCHYIVHSLTSVTIRPSSTSET